MKTLRLLFFFSTLTVTGCIEGENPDSIFGDVLAECPVPLADPASVSYLVKIPEATLTLLREHELPTTVDFTAEIYPSADALCTSDKPSPKSLSFDMSATAASGAHAERSWPDPDPRFVFVTVDLDILKSCPSTGNCQDTVTVKVVRTDADPTPVEIGWKAKIETEAVLLADDRGEAKLELTRVP
jgi:hypothetical protein